MTVHQLIQAVWTHFFMLATVIIVAGSLPTLLTGLYFLLREFID